MGGFQAIQLNICKNFKNQVQRIVNKRQIEFLKDEVIGHIVTTTSSEQQATEIAWQNTNIARKADDMIKELMSYPKCRSVEVINNPTRLGSNHREVNYINYK